jgi:hypothetical protein
MVTEGYTQGVCGKSRCIEMDNWESMMLVNATHASCINTWVADYFSCSTAGVAGVGVVVTVHAFILDADEPDRGHSLTM